MYQLAGQSWVYTFQLGFHLIVKKRFRWSQSSLNTNSLMLPNCIIKTAFP